MKNDDIFKKLYSVLLEEDTENLWLELLNNYYQEGGNLLLIDSFTGRSLLHCAADNLFKEVIEWLISKGLDINLREKNTGWTAYLIALDSAIDSAIQHDEPEIDFSVVKYLITHGADMEVCSNDGRSRKSLLKLYGPKVEEAYYKAVK